MSDTNMARKLKPLEKLWYFGVVSVLIAAVSAQDTLLRDGHNSYKPLKYGGQAGSPSNSGAWQNEVTRLQDRMDHRLRETERRLLRRLHEKLHNQNHVQQSSNHELQKTMQHLSQHLEDVREMLTAKDDVIEKLKQQVTHQQRELHKHKNNMDRLHKTVTDLSDLVEELLEQRQVTSQPAPVTSPASTTPVPFNPVFPVGKY